MYEMSDTLARGEPSVSHSPGARDRLEAIYNAHYPAIHQYAARRTDSPDDTADVISETFLTAWRRIADVPDGDAARLWLYGVARRVLANHRRGQSRRTGLAERLKDELSATRPSEPAGPDRVREAFDDLPARDREVLALAFWEDLTGPEIGKVLGCTATAARIRLHRARKRLAKALGLTEEDQAIAELRGETL
ncbi:RNA polymerase sigma factor [Nonomuraea sp. 3-1Str]|uniref:RNA polymerase sigma factor n=1 Tax=Nonomuraea sp. 3-1Str TaxID=2929801 RepID=UPI00285844C3|nr:RNA polymerase sigma factor [Nonomuraea sp. 3-1Str]MDR8413730.1 RNA polymerase sigma factor [Nonomuraea sp. 3-1Str]